MKFVLEILNHHYLQNLDMKGYMREAIICRIQLPITQQIFIQIIILKHKNYC
jgi:hypothetical protein